MTTTISGSVVNTSKVISDDEDFTNPPAVLTPQSMVRLNTANGYGAVNTKIRRFTNIVANQGSDITYADSANDGASFTINTDGVYAIHYSACFSASAWLGISLNSTQLTTNIQSITAADKLAVSNSGGVNFQETVAVTSFLSAGDVIRAHTEGTGSGAQVDLFTITRVS